MKSPTVIFIRKHLTVLLGIVGFIFGAFSIRFMGDYTFHERDYKPRAILDSILSHPQLPDIYYTDAQNDTLREEAKFRLLLNNNLSDSVHNKLLLANQLYINKADADKSNILDIDNVNVQILWDYYITYSLKYEKPVTPHRFGNRSILATKKYRSYMGFVAKYPGFILWLLLIVIQYPLFAFLTAFAWSELKRVQKHFSTRLHLVLSDKLLVSAIIVVCFVIVSYVTFFMGHPIMGGLFCSKDFIKLTFGFLLLFAASSGITAFTGFMLIAECCKNVCTDISGGIAKSGADAYRMLNTMFNRMMICSSIALSIIVFATGVLFMGLNSIDFIRKITADFGQSPVAYHFVFLIGILCTGLILIFFLPAKIQLMYLEKVCNANDIELGKSEDIFSKLKTFFTIGMPALIPVFQFFLSLFFNK